MLETLNQLIAENVTIRKERRLTLPGEVLVHEGERVEPDTVIAKTGLVPGAPCVIAVASLLKVSPAETSSLVTKAIGDRVLAGDVVARVNKGFFGGIIEIKSPVSGIVEFISDVYGRMLIREDQREAAPAHAVPVARLLDVSPSRLRWYLRFEEGQEVNAGQIIATDFSAMAPTMMVYAPVTGTIERICTRTGQVYIRRPYRPVLCNAYLTGTVESVIPEYGAVVATKGSYLQGIFGLGNEADGTLRIAVSDPTEILDAPAIRTQDRGSVLVGGSMVTMAALRKAIECGVRGIIVGGANHGDLSQLLGREIGVGVTGHESLALSIVMTEGFGALPMTERIFALLKQAHGRHVSLDGSTQVRAGVIRPEVIIPAAEDIVTTELAAYAERHALTVGAPVRIVRAPYFGLRGEVTDLPEAPEQVESESRVQVAVVALNDGRSVRVPVQNVEVA